MSAVGDVLNLIGQDVIPEVGAIAFPDTMVIKAEAPAKSASGGAIKGTVTDAYTAVPVAYEPGKGKRIEKGGTVISSNGYLLTFPTHTAAGARINVDANIHRFIVNARGNEPAKTFRPIAIAEDGGVIFEATCERE